MVTTQHLIFEPSNWNLSPNRVQSYFRGPSYREGLINLGYMYIPVSSQVERQLQVELGVRRGGGPLDDLPLVEPQCAPRPRPREARRVPPARHGGLRRRQLGGAAAQVEAEAEAAAARQAEGEEVSVAVGALPVVEDELAALGLGVVGEEPDLDVELPAGRLSNRETFWP